MVRFVWMQCEARRHRKLYAVVGKILRVVNVNVAKANKLWMVKTCLEDVLFKSCVHVSRIADDGSVEITWEEWRDYLILSPSSDLHDVFRFWRHATVSFTL